MRKFFASMVLLAAAATAMAQPADGYYRVQNYMTARYAYVLDNKGKVDYSTTSIDLGAIGLWKGFEKAVADPSTVVYLKKHSGAEYNLYAQGTDVYTFTGYYVKLREDTRAKGSYWAYATANGMTKYLTDAEYSSTEEGAMSDFGDYTSNSTKFCRNWLFLPVDQEDDRYFGIMPEVQVEDTYYTTMYAGFPFSFASSGMKAYYASEIVNGNWVVITELTDQVPASTPVLISCSSATPSNNRLNLFYSTASAPSSNLMAGVYFNNSSILHNNRLAYNPSTMRVLGLTSTGQVGFVKANIDYLPANKAYLKVPAGTPDELYLVTREDFESGIQDVRADRAAQVKGVYTLTGIKVRENATSLEGLPAGIYIVNGKKVAVK